VTQVLDGGVSFCLLKLLRAVRNVRFLCRTIRAAHFAAVHAYQNARRRVERFARANLRGAVAGALFLATLPLAGLAGGVQGKAGDQPAAKPIQAAGSDRGQQVFEQNCSRCHNAPEGFSPRISGTIARHMRVRAALGDEDYKALRRFLNP
jgi:cytochrome c5